MCPDAPSVARKRPSWRACDNSVVFDPRREAGAASAPSMRLIKLLLCMPLIGACTVINIHKSDNAVVDVRSIPGLASITLSPGERGAIVLQTSGVGAIRTPTGTTLGAWRETAALLGSTSNCRTVIWVSEARELAAVMSMLLNSGQKLETLCVINARELP